MDFEHSLITIWKQKRKVANAKSIHFPFCFQSNYSENNNNGQIEETRLCGLFKVYLLIPI